MFFKRPMIHLKSEREIERLRASADLVARALGEVARHVRPGATTLELDAIAETYIRDHGAEPAFKGYQISDSVPPFPASLCTSVNNVVVHGIPDERPLEDGDLLSVDCGVLLDGYYGDTAYTFGVGEISAEKAELCYVTHEALRLGIEQAADGNRVGDISNAVQSFCEDHGYGVVSALVGHGIGRSLHEEPNIPNVGRAGKGRRLKKGLVICIEPMINTGTGEVSTLDDGWTVVTGDGLPSAHYEHTVAIDRGNAEVLSSYEYIEEIVDAPYHKAQTANG